MQHRDAGAGGPPFDDRHRYNAILELGSDFTQGRFVDPEILDRHLRDRRDTLLCEVVFLFDAPLVERNTLRQLGGSNARPVIDMQECPITGARSCWP